MASIILKDKYKIDNINEGITLTESLDGTAYVANLELITTDDFLKHKGIGKSNSISIYDISYETKKLTKLFYGLVWETSRNRSNKKMNVTCKERTIYLEQSEDEYLFPSGMTATQRIKKYCRDWNIAIGNLKDTKINLSKAFYRGNTIYDMIQKDIKETAKKGGKLYKLRMVDKLDIIELGSNENVWKLETIAEEINTTNSLNGAITQVKVLGKQTDKKKTPIIGIYKKKADVYGTLQKLIQDEKVKNGAEAKKRADALLNTGEETVRVSGVDINTIRAGDKVSIDGQILYVIDVTHKLGSTGRMDLNLGTCSGREVNIWFCGYIFIVCRYI